MATQLYDIPKDRTTQTGGQCNIAAWLLDARPTYLAMIARLAELRETPRTEQSQFVLGQIAELQSALTVAEDALWNALESGATA
jgi:hypothetical protein